MKLLAGYAPLCIDEEQLNELSRISPAVRDLVLAELAEISKVLTGTVNELSDHARSVLQNPLEGLLSSSTELNFVYTPGHVGSCTVAATLEKHLSSPSPIPVAHTLSTKGLAFLQRVGEKCPRWPSGTWRESVFWSRLMRLRVMLSLSLCALGRRSGMTIRKPFVITGVREPVAGHISCCFYSWWAFADKPEGVTEKIVHEELRRNPWHLRCNDFFDDELNEMLGIDVFARPFPTERGWHIYENQSARVLLIRQESLARLSDALGALYGRDPSEFSLVTSNAAEDKDYAVHYNAVKKALRLSEHEMDEIYSAAYVRHFYTAEEIAEFKRRWRATDADRKAA